MGIVQWFEAHPAVTGLLGVFLTAVLTAAITGLFALIKPVTTREVLEDRDSWPGLIEDYRKGGAAAYFAAISRVLGFADRVWGSAGYRGFPGLSGQAFGRCYQIAFVYPLLTMLIGWVVFNIATLGGVPFFDDSCGFWGRAWRALALIAGSVIAGLIFANADKFSDFLVEKLFGPLDRDSPRPSVWRKFGRGLVGFLAVAGAVAFAGAVAVAGAVAGNVAFAVAFAVAGAGAVAGNVAGAFAFAFAFAVAFAFAGAEPEDATVLILFFSLLPLLNACADTASLAITRRFLGKIAQDRPSFRFIALQICADLIWAVLCLSALLGAIIGVLEIWKALAPTTLAFSWQDYWVGIKADPSSGTALYLMALTTVFPTIVHLLAGLGAALTYRGQGLARVADLLHAKLAEGAQELTKHELGKAQRQIWLANTMGYFLSALITGAVFYGVWWLGAWIWSLL